MNYQGEYDTGNEMAWIDISQEVADAYYDGETKIIKNVRLKPENDQTTTAQFVLNRIAELKEENRAFEGLSEHTQFIGKAARKQAFELCEFLIRNYIIGEELPETL